MRFYFLCSTLTLLLLSACTGGGYSRPYIISEGAEEAVVEPPAGHR